MKWCLVLLLGVAILSTHNRAQACSESASWSTIATLRQPDIPLEKFAAGQMGLLRATFARTYLVVAYRHLVGLPLDGVEQQGAMEVWKGTLRNGQPFSSAIQRWVSHRADALGISITHPWFTEGNVTPHGEQYWIAPNCLDGAFESAIATLTARQTIYGAGSPSLLAWIKRQDAVFDHCEHKATPVPEASPGSNLLALADYAYQNTAASFYSQSWSEAEAGFRKIATDTRSPWRTISRYLVARTLVRRAFTEGKELNLVLLEAAKRELTSILADASVADIHRAARDYLPYVRRHLERATVAREFSIELGRGGLGKRFGSVLDDYAFIHDDESVAQDPPAESDRLATWIYCMREGNFDCALALYQRTKANVWLVAALMTATAKNEGELPALLKAASAVGRASPAFATVQYHRLRLLDSAQRAREIPSVRSLLRPEDGVSTHNEFQVLALRSASSLAELLAASVAESAGDSEDGDDVDVTLAPGGGSRGFFPEAAALLTFGLPTSDLVAATKNRDLTAVERATLMTALYIRAQLVGDENAVAAVAPMLRSAVPTLAQAIDRIESAAPEAKRRFEFLYAMARVPTLSYRIPVWGAATAREDRIGGRGFYWWCVPPSDHRPDPPPFLDSQRRKLASHQANLLIKLGSGPTYLASSLADLAPKLPRDERVAEALHLAVLASRYGCKNERTTKEAARAFTVLHRMYPKSPWAKRTKHYY